MRGSGSGLRLLGLGLRLGLRLRRLLLGRHRDGARASTNLARARLGGARAAPRRGGRLRQSGGLTGRWACCPTARNADRRRPTARARCVYNGTRRRARRGRRRARGRPPVHLDSRGYVSPLGQEDQQARVSPVSSPQRPRRRVLVPRCPPFPSDDDPLPRAPSQAREELARRADDRTRSILVLAQRFLLDDGLLESARARARERRSPLPDGRRGQRPPPGRHPRVVRRSRSTARTPPETHARRGRRRGGRSAAARAAAPGRPGATAGAERRAARVAAERDAARRRASSSRARGCRTPPRGGTVRTPPLLPFRELWVGFHARAVRRPPGSPSASKIRRRGGRGDASRGRDDAERGFGFSGGETRARGAASARAG